MNTAMKTVIVGFTLQEAPETRKQIPDHTSLPQFKASRLDFLRDRSMMEAAQQSEQPEQPGQPSQQPPREEGEEDEEEELRQQEEQSQDQNEEMAVVSQPEDDQHEPAPDQFAEFMQLGDAAVVARAETSPTTPTANANVSTNPNPSPPSPLAFLSGLFSKATSTLENTFQSASEEIHTATQEFSNVSSDALNQATMAGTQALSTVTGLVVDLARPSNTSLPSETTALKPYTSPSDILVYLRTSQGTHVAATATALYCHPFREESLYHISWSDDGQHAISTPAPPEGRMRRKPVLAVAGVDIGQDEVAMMHEDGAVRVYSVREETFGILKRAGAAEEFVGNRMAFINGHIHIGNGEMVRVLDRALGVVNVLQAPEICRCVVGGVERWAGVSCVGWGVGYEDGVVDCSDGKPFVAQGGKVGGVLQFYDGVLAVTCGNEVDTSVGVFEVSSGRCLVRRMMPFVPSGIWRVRGYEEGICPSENVFVVGGVGGEVEIFRVVVVSVERVEVRLVRRISERARGKKKVEGVLYVREEGVLCAWSGAVVRRWQLGKVDVGGVSMRPREGGVGEDDVEKRLDEEVGGIEAQVGGILRAQNVLAMILDEESIAERVKDELVVEFQRAQADMLVKVGAADTELRRAGRRIRGTFGRGMEGSSGGEVEKRLRRQVKRCAAFEIEFALRRHAERVREIKRETLDKLKALLMDSLKGREGIEALREEVLQLVEVNE